MKKLIKIGFLINLIFFLSGCVNLNTPSKPKIDTTLEPIKASSIKYISDISSIALEWQPVYDSRVQGYKIYRLLPGENTTRLRLIKNINSRFASHFVDANLKPSTRYIYAISSYNKFNQESKLTRHIKTITLKAIKPISFIQAISNQPRQIKILWRPHKNPSISHYIIERLNRKKQKWIVIIKLKNRFNIEYIDKKLRDKTTYFYRVRAITFNNISSRSSKVVKATTKQRPKPPRNAIATLNLPKKIILRWKHSITKDIVKYKIYLSYYEKGSYRYLNQVTNRQNSFTHRLKQDGKKIFYKITAVDKDGLETSLDINSILGQTLPKPKRPIITLAQIQNQKVIINWKASDKRAKTYIVYKTSKKGFLRSRTIKFVNIEGLRFEDKNIRPNMIYRYSIQAIDDNNLLSNQTPYVELSLPKIEKQDNSQ